jgi:hypothetical protein
MPPPSRSTSDPLTPQLLDALRAQLAAGERLAWAVCPEPSAFERTTRGADRWEAAAIVGGGYAILAAAVIALTGHWRWLSVPISLVLIGLLTLSVTGWLKQRARKSVAGTVYGLTTRRALIMQTYPALALQVMPIDAIGDITLVGKRADFGDLRLGHSPGLVFRGVLEPERARSLLMRVVSDPPATEQELAAAEAYSIAMHQLRVRSAS